MLTIVAHDCGMLTSKSTIVTVHVKQRCIDGIKKKMDLLETNEKRFANNLEAVLCPRVSFIYKRLEASFGYIK